MSIARSIAMARADHPTGGNYCISTYAAVKRISFSQFLIDDDESALIHTGTFPTYADVRSTCSMPRASATSLFLTLKPTNAAVWGVSSPRHLLPCWLAVH